MSKILFFPLLAKYSQRARPKRNAYFIHKTISVREKIAQIHTNTQRSYCDVMTLLQNWYEWYNVSITVLGIETSEQCLQYRGLRMQ